MDPYVANDVVMPFFVLSGLEALLFLAEEKSILQEKISLEKTTGLFRLFVFPDKFKSRC